MSGSRESMCRMLKSSLRILALTVGVAGGLVCIYAQPPDDRSLITSRANEEKVNQPSSLKETLEKLRIEREKKEHREMLERGEEALRISEQLEKTFAQTGKLSDKEYSKLAAVEKIVKKIRSDLGGDDDDSEYKDTAKESGNSLSPSEAIKSLRAKTVTLFDELKKTTRFSISAAAIQSSNAVIKIARLLRISN